MAMRWTSVLVGLCLWVSAVVPSAPAGEGGVPKLAPKNDSDWVTDLRAGIQAAQAAKKDVFVNFTGSDWCTYCQKLDEQVFSKETFLKAVKKNFVLVKLDFPKTKPVPKPVMQQRQAFAQKLNVRGFPTIILFTAEGKPYARTGYKPGGVDAFLKTLKEFRDRKKTIFSGMETFKTAEDVADKRNAATSAVDAMVENNVMMYLRGFVKEPVESAIKTFDESKDAAEKKSAREFAFDIIQKSGTAGAFGDFVKKTDPKNEHGLLEIVAFGEAQKKAQIDPVGAVETLDGFLKKHKVNRPQLLHVFAAQLLTNAKKFDEAIQRLEKAKSLKGQMSEQIPQMIQKIKQVKAQQQNAGAGGGLGGFDGGL